MLPYVSTGTIVSSDGHICDTTKDAPGQCAVYIYPGDVSSEAFRLATFRRFQQTCPVLPTKFARSGFHYTGYKDRVKCFSCGLSAENWMMGDDPSEKHWHRSDCDFANGRDTKNQPMLSLYRKHLALQRRSSAANAEEIPISSAPVRAVPTQRYPCNNPVNPHMRSAESRRASFQTRRYIRWPSEKLRAGIEELVQAGLFYIGDRDRVKCWYCNGGLQNWEYEDDPWVEHVKWFPSCEYAHRIKGSEFINSILAQYPQLNRPTPIVTGRSTASTTSSLVQTAPNMIPEVSQQTVVDEAMGSLSYVAKAKEMRISDSTIRELLQKKYKENGQFYSSAEEFMDALFSKEASPSSSPACQNSGNESAGSEESRCDLTSQLRKLEELRLCRLCRSEASVMVMLPCGHLCACEKCGQGGRLKRCPVCSLHVHKSIKTYRA